MKTKTSIKKEIERVFNNFVEFNDRYANDKIDKEYKKNLSVINLGCLQGLLYALDDEKISCEYMSKVQSNLDKLKKIL